MNFYVKPFLNASTVNWRATNSVRADCNKRSLFNSDENKNRRQMGSIWFNAMSEADPDYVEMMADAFAPHD